MKRSFIAATVLIFLAMSALAFADSTTCKTFDTAHAGGPGNNDKRFDACMELCKRNSDDLNYYLSNNWTIVATRPYVIVQQPFKPNLVGVPDVGYCRCNGTEYILRR